MSESDKIKKETTSKKINSQKNEIPKNMKAPKKQMKFQKKKMKSKIFKTQKFKSSINVSIRHCQSQII